MESGTPHILLEIYVSLKGMDRKLKESATMKREQQVSPECRKFFTDRKSHAFKVGRFSNKPNRYSVQNFGGFSVYIYIYDLSERGRNWKLYLK